MNRRSRSLHLSSFLRLGLLGLGLAACETKAPAVTGLVVKVTFQAGPDQLEFLVGTPDRPEALASTTRPKDPGPALKSPQTVTIYLPDDLADQDATVTVNGLVGRQEAQASGKAIGRLVLHQLVQVDVELLPVTAPDGGMTFDASDDGATDGEATDDGGSDAPTEAAPGDGPRANGQPCGTGDECESTLCVSGVCCASACGGFCEACNLPGKEGTCAPKVAGTPTLPTQCAKQPASGCGFDGTCDGNGGCRRHPAGVACKAESCLANSYMPAAACDGQGTCMAPSPVDCKPYACDTTGGPPACRADCRASSAADCVAPAVCVNASCGAKPKKADGAGCVDGGECTSTHCNDGVCCATACTGACVSCNQTGFLGMCHPVAAGKADPHAVCKDAGAAGCKQSGLCDGASACALYPATTVCAAGSCAGRIVHPAKHCDGKGTCAVAADIDCLPYRCDAATTACFTACVNDRQCATAPTKRNCTALTCQ